MKEFIIRFTNKNDYQFLPGIEDSAGKAFLAIGMEDIACMDNLPVSYYNKVTEPSYIMVAESKNAALVGFCLINLVDSQPHIKELSVAREHSGQGIGKALINRICEESKQKGYKSITLTTFAEVPFNAPFYKKLGFKQFDINNEWPELSSILQKEKDGPLKAYSRIAMIKHL